MLVDVGVGVGDAVLVDVGVGAGVEFGVGVGVGGELITKVVVSVGGASALERTKVPVAGLPFVLPWGIPFQVAV